MSACPVWVVGAGALTSLQLSSVLYLLSILLEFSRDCFNKRWNSKLYCIVHSL